MKNDSKNYESFYTEDGWLIAPEDDIFDEIFTDDTIDLFEGIVSKETLDPLRFVIASIDYQNGSKPNADGTYFKERPTILLVKYKDDTGFWGFQITHQGPKEGKFSTQFRLELQNPKRYSLDRELCYINYDHFVSVEYPHIHKDLHTMLSLEDCKRLYHAITAHYNLLMSKTDNIIRKKEFDTLLKFLKLHIEAQELAENKSAENTENKPAENEPVENKEENKESKPTETEHIEENEHK